MWAWLKLRQRYSSPLYLAVVLCLVARLIGLALG